MIHLGCAFVCKRSYVWVLHWAFLQVYGSVFSCLDKVQVGESDEEVCVGAGAATADKQVVDAHVFDCHSHGGLGTFCHVGFVSEVHGANSGQARKVVPDATKRVCAACIVMSVDFPDGICSMLCHRSYPKLLLVCSIDHT